MIKDLQDSKRIDTRVHDRNQVRKSFSLSSLSSLCNSEQLCMQFQAALLNSVVIQGLPLHATIVSRLFWPSFQPAPLKLPGQLGRFVLFPLFCTSTRADPLLPPLHSAQSEYEKSFVRQKPDKKLRWLPQLGTVNLTIELKDRTLQLDVSPLQASLLELFNQEGVSDSLWLFFSMFQGLTSPPLRRADTWSTEDLGIELRLTDFTAIRNGLYFWNNQGVLKSLPEDQWKLLEEKDQAEEDAAAHGESVE